MPREARGGLSHPRVGDRGPVSSCAISGFFDTCYAARTGGISRKEGEIIGGSRRGGGQAGAARNPALFSTGQTASVSFPRRLKRAFREGGKGKRYGLLLGEPRKSTPGGAVLHLVGGAP